MNVCLCVWGGACVGEDACLNKSIDLYVYKCVFVCVVGCTCRRVCVFVLVCRCMCACSVV